ncbi:MAG: SURF1 family cytochrome oxidase biogenesis protein [Microbacterium sp.]|uniref:SURF1 family cytochrome oxidase biogenesis protein n=1 Tax=Microbacterium sp. TaxID=51671 RepID=UPI003A8BA652
MKAQGATRQAPAVFPPTLREVLLRPRWLALLVLCLVVAGVFAWLGQWQLSRAVDIAPAPPGSTEQVQPIDDVVVPGAYLNGPQVGQRVSVSGQWIADDFLVVSSRFNDDVEGYWVTGQLRVSGSTGSGTGATPTSLAVAVGWAPTRAQAEAVASTLSAQVAQNPAAVYDLTGRIISDEGPAAPPRDADPQEMTRMSPAALLSRWHDIEGLDVYRPFLTADQPLGDLVAISSPAPVEGSPVNWLNIFYAAEWAVFGGFAFYLWYRLAKDAWERELEELDEEAAT